ncbi:PilZ domain-containing protein, partial [Halomonas sp. BC04]|uniref:PilZ domain-containing protein n=1 Tax=Halomonas sp. BC04 TaxID=1403540 RepID=UPI0005BADB70
MADHFPRDDQERHEPTLGGSTPEGGSSVPEPAGQDSVRLTKGDRIQHERRDERGYIRVAIPFRVSLSDDSTLNGSDVSLGGFSAHSNRAFQPGERISASLLMMAGPTELIVPLRAECLRAEPADGKGHQVSFEITEIEPPHRELLRQVIRSALSGRSPNIEGLMAGEDPQTPRKRQTGAVKPTPPARQPKPMGRYILLFLAIGLLVLVGAATAYRNFMLIEPNFAAVTAPRIDIRAPGPGILAAHDLQAGDRVKLDQFLTNVVNSDLESDLILAEAALDYNNRLIENLQAHLDGGIQEVSLANSAQPASGDTMTFESVSPEIAQARIEQFETVRDYENSRIAALEARQS